SHPADDGKLELLAHESHDAADEQGYHHHKDEEVDQHAKQADQARACSHTGESDHHANDVQHDYGGVEQYRLKCRKPSEFIRLIGRDNDDAHDQADKAYRKVCETCRDVWV